MTYSGQKIEKILKISENHENGVILGWFFSSIAENNPETYLNQQQQDFSFFFWKTKQIKKNVCHHLKNC